MRQGEFSSKMGHHITDMQLYKHLPGDAIRSGVNWAMKKTMIGWGI